MWVKRSEYMELVKQNASMTATVEWLRQQLNHERRELAMLKQRAIGLPMEVPNIERIAFAVPTPAQAAQVSDVPEDKRPTMQDIFAGHIGFEDMGDEEAQRQGVDWDESTGSVRYR